MTVVLVALIAATLLEIGADFITSFWNLRKYLVPVLIFGIAFGSGGIFMARPGVPASLILVISAYRIFNELRIIEARINESYLLRITRLTSVWLIVMQLAVAGVWWLSHQFDFHWITLLAALQLATAIVLAAATIRQLKKTLPINTNKTYADRELPSLTVAIPARNEDQQLEECLRSILRNDYPKLEVIVLDDCSQDRTSQIIRNFAHDGVRFIPGQAPKTNWLAKNQAYDQLAKEASGDLILFCGVDVRFAAQSIRQVVTLMLAKQKRMLTVMPLNEQPKLSFAQSIRYYWELALPRRTFNRPPVLSSCWLIEAAFVTESGGFRAVSNSITPEAFFARCAVKEDAYAFTRSTSHVGIVSVKSAVEQYETAVRVRYPQLHRRPELVLLVVIAELLLLFAPYLLTIIGFWGVFGVAAESLFALSCILLTVTYRSISYATSPVNSWYLSPLFPIMVLVDTALLHYSMSKYEFSTVEWKGRNVCVPVLQVKPRLPKIP